MALTVYQSRDLLSRDPDGQPTQPMPSDYTAFERYVINAYGLNVLTEYYSVKDETFGFIWDEDPQHIEY